MTSSRRESNQYNKAEDGIRDIDRSRGLGDVYKRQSLFHHLFQGCEHVPLARTFKQRFGASSGDAFLLQAMLSCLTASISPVAVRTAKLCMPFCQGLPSTDSESPGRGCLLAGVLDSWAISGLLCPVLCWIGLTPVLMTSSMTTEVRNDVTKMSSNFALR